MTFRRFLATAVLVALGTCVPARADEVSWLFLQNAEAASFDGKTLRLEGVDPETTAFSERPYRAVQTIPTAGFVAMWGVGSEALVADPPNAGLSGLEGEAFRNVVVELSNPRLDGDALVYSVAVLHGTVPAAMTDVSLMVDAWPTAVNSQITDSVTQTNVKVLGDAPALTTSDLPQATMDAPVMTLPVQPESSVLDDDSALTSAQAVIDALNQAASSAVEAPPVE